MPRAPRSTRQRTCSRCRSSSSSHTLLQHHQRPMQPQQTLCSSHSSSCWQQGLAMGIPNLARLTLRLARTRHLQQQRQVGASSGVPGLVGLGVQHPVRNHLRILLEPDTCLAMHAAGAYPPAYGQPYAPAPHQAPGYGAPPGYGQAPYAASPYAAGLAPFGIRLSS